MKVGIGGSYQYFDRRVVKVIGLGFKYPNSILSGFGPATSSNSGTALRG